MNSPNCSETLQHSASSHLCHRPASSLGTPPPSQSPGTYVSILRPPRDLSHLFSVSAPAPGACIYLRDPYSTPSRPRQGPAWPLASAEACVRSGDPPPPPQPSRGALVPHSSGRPHLLGRLRVEHQHEARRVAVQPEEVIEEPVSAEPAGAHYQSVGVQQFQHQLPLVFQERRHSRHSSRRARLHGRPSGAAAERSRRGPSLRREWANQADESRA